MHALRQGGGADGGQKRGAPFVYTAVQKCKDVPYYFSNQAVLLETLKRISSKNELMFRAIKGKEDHN